MRHFRLEKHLEKAAIRLYKKLFNAFHHLPPKSKVEGAVKLNTMGRRAWPDRMFIGPLGRVLYVEFKKEGKEPTPLQRAVQLFLQKCGHAALRIDNVGDAECALAALFNLNDALWRAEVRRQAVNQDAKESARKAKLKAATNTLEEMPGDAALDTIEDSLERARQRQRAARRKRA